METLIHTAKANSMSSCSLSSVTADLNADLDFEEESTVAKAQDFEFPLKLVAVDEEFSQELMGNMMTQFKREAAKPKASKAERAAYCIHPEANQLRSAYRRSELL